MGKVKIQKTTKQFIDEANKIFNNIYDYNKVNYINNYSYVTITCKIHGEFSQKPRSHLEGKGCSNCGNIKKTKTLTEDSKNINTVLYFIKIYNSEEEFYKIGYTTKNINRRFSSDILNGIYEYEEIRKKEVTLEEAITEEQNFIKTFSNYKYTPKHKFGGYTECFKKEIYNIMFPVDDIV